MLGAWEKDDPNLSLFHIWHSCVSAKMQNSSIRQIRLLTRQQQLTEASSPIARLASWSSSYQQPSTKPFHLSSLGLRITTPTFPTIALTVIALNHTNRKHEGCSFRRSVAAGLSERGRPQNAAEEGLSVRAAGLCQHRYPRQAPRPEVHGYSTSVAH